MPISHPVASRFSATSESGGLISAAVSVWLSCVKSVGKHAVTADALDAPNKSARVVSPDVSAPPSATRARKPLLRLAESARNRDIPSSLEIKRSHPGTAFAPPCQEWELMDAGTYLGAFTLSNDNRPRRSAAQGRRRELRVL